MGKRSVSMPREKNGWGEVARPPADTIAAKRLQQGLPEIETVSKASSPSVILETSWSAVREIYGRYSDRLSHHSSESAGQSGTEQFFPGAVKWILDHYRFLETQIVELREALCRRSYR